MAFKEMIESGMLRHKVYFMRRVTQQDELGGHQEQWVKAFPGHSWAHIKTAAVNTQEVAQQDAMETQYHITMRGKAGLTEDMVLWWPLKNVVYVIDKIMREEQRDRMLKITARVRRDLETRGW